MSKVILARSKKCCKCPLPAVAFWPVIDPDIPSNPYCRRCLDEAKMRVMMKLLQPDKKDRIK